jgi:hypothetical protein
MAASALNRPKPQPVGLSDFSALATLPPTADVDAGEPVMGEPAAPAAAAPSPARPAPMGGLSDLAGLGSTIERDSPAGDEPVAAAPAAARAAPAPVRPAPMGGLSDLAGLASTIERDSPAGDEPAPAASAPSTARPAPMGGLSDLAGLSSTIERDSPAGDEPLAAAPAPSAPVAAAPPASGPRGAPVARVSRQVPQTPTPTPSAAAPSAGGAADLDAFLAQSNFAGTPQAAAPSAPSADAYVPQDGSAAPAPEAGSEERTEEDKEELDENGQPIAKAAGAPVITVEPLRPTAPIDPSLAFMGLAHPAQVIDAAIREMPADPSTLELAKRWQDINTGLSSRYEAATRKYVEHKAAEDMRAPAALAAAGLSDPMAGGRAVRGGGLTSIARGLAGMGRRGVAATRRAVAASKARAADGELSQIREEMNDEATGFARNFFGTKARHYEDRLGELDTRHGSLKDAIADYNRTFAAAPAAAPFLAAVTAFAGQNGLTQDQALADAAAGTAGPDVASALAAVRGAALSDPAVDAARAGMREAEDVFQDTAHRARKDFESLLRFSTPEDGFDAEKTSEDLVSRIKTLAEDTPDPVAEEEGKAKMRERMRELAESVARMIREMFDRMFRAVTGAFGR